MFQGGARLYQISKNWRLQRAGYQKKISQIKASHVADRYNI